MMPPRVLNKIGRLGTLVLMAFSLLLAACGGSGGGNSSNPAPPTTSNTNTSFIYSGPAPNSAAVQRFQQAFYNNLVNDNRCGTCHTRGGAGKTAFVDRTDVNFAYSEALTLVDTENPAASKIVEKVYSNGTGHNCWEASPAACRVQMISFIENWLNNGDTASTSVKLTAPKDRDPNGAGDGFRNYPDTASAAGFTAGAVPPTLYGMVLTYCSRCHSETSTVKQQPYFASSDPNVAYEAIKSKIDLNDPSLIVDPTVKAKSRLVVRLRDEFHNCWSSSCAADADAMQAAIRSLAQSITPVKLNAAIYRSKAQVLNDGVVGTSGGRFELYQIALWRFLEGEGNVVSDTSGVSPGISLTIKGTEGDTGDFKWIGGGGIQFNGAVAYDAKGASKKLYDLIAPAGEYSIEAWTLPANVTDENREIVSYSNGTDRRNFMLGQSMYNYDYYNRSSATNTRGMVGTTKFSSDPTNTVEKGALQAALQHVVLTYDAVNGRKIFVDDKLVSTAYPDDRGTLANDWDQTYEVVMGNTLAQPKGAEWKGALRMVAVHKRALSPAQIAQNFAVKPGEKRYVMFNVSQIANMPASCRGTDASNNPISYCFVYFEISQLDNYAYLFNKPYFISLNSDISDLSTLVIKGIHIGINGKLSSEGQAYVNVDTTIKTASDYVSGDSPGSGQLLLNVGTVVPKLSGADADLMYLEFDQIGPNISPVVNTPSPSFTYKLNGDPAIDLGWRTFDEINASFSKMTGMPVTASTGAPNGSTFVKVSDVFNGVRSQLPAVEDFSAYLSSHQTSVTQLAVAYCAALMRDPSNHWQTFFGVAQASDLKANNWNALVNPLVDTFFSNVNLYTTSPPAAISVANQTRTELHSLLTNSGNNRKNGFCVGGTGNDICNTSDEIFNAATVTCAAALANAAMTLQ